LQAQKLRISDLAEAAERTLRLRQVSFLEVHRHALAKLELLRLGLRRKAVAMSVTRGS
jgi:hypothetical protein